MNEGRLRELVETYVAGWRDGDRERILSALTDDCVVVESHGPVYRRNDVVARWIDRWNAERSRIERTEDAGTLHRRSGRLIGTDCARPIERAEGPGDIRPRPLSDSGESWRPPHLVGRGEQEGQDGLEIGSPIDVDLRNPELLCQRCEVPVAIDVRSCDQEICVW